jgi:hypothetical protein
MATTLQSVEVSRRSSTFVALFSLTLFVSAALLFLLEPMFAKMTLPVLGGTTAVWATCMLFYQAMLLAGYAFANVLTRRTNTRQQALLFLVLVLVPLMFLPCSFPAGRVPPGDRNPIPWLLTILTTVVGLPFFVMSAITPTFQKWFEGIGDQHSSDPYFLYAASNVGSILGLLSYPILIEPRFSLAEQSRVWEYGYIFLVILVVICAVTMWRVPRRGPEPGYAAPLQNAVSTSVPAFRERLLWMVLAFVPSSLMLGVTTVLTTEIPPIPMLWVLPLAVYLLTFILVFARKPVISYSDIAKSMPLVILAGMLPLLLKMSWPMYLDIAINLMTLFVVAVACHGELAKRRPPAEHLTGFYLWIALGGVLGGLFNAVIAPLVFSTVVEFPLALLAAALLRQVMTPAPEGQRFKWVDVALPLAMGALEIILILVPRKFGIEPGVISNLIVFGPAVLLCFSFGKRPIRFALGFAALLIAGSGYSGAYQHNIISTQRSFYGINRVAIDDTGHYRVLYSGKTIHGIQSLSPEQAREPLSYYSRSSPIGQIFKAFSGSNKFKEVGVAGLGAGTLACYAQPGEEFTFYEIDPAVERIARDPQYFTYLRDFAPQARVVLGDARISLRNAPDHHFGFFIVDVFGGDAIPVHLLTRQAVQLYLSKLDPHGVVATHISNRYLHLQKVVGNLARDAGLVALIQDDKTKAGAGKIPSTWVVMARSDADLGALTADPRWVVLKGDPGARVWTDDYSSVLTVFNWD